MNDSSMSDAATVVRGARSAAPGWYALRTRGRHEKKVHKDLSDRGIESFLATVARWSRWKDRTKRIEEPLFTCYTFARLMAPEHALVVLKIRGVVQIMGGPHGPEPIDDSEIEGVRRVVDGVLPYDPHPFLSAGMEVEVVRGPLVGMRGVLLRKDRAAKLVISIALIRQAAAVAIHPADVVPVRTIRPALATNGRR